MSSASDTAVLAYVASPHAGYLKFFRAYEGSTLFILGRDFIAEFPSLTRHLPGNDPLDAHRMIKALGIFSSVRILTHETLGGALRFPAIVMPDEDVSHALAERYFHDVPVTFDGSWRLRFDWGATTMNRDPEPDGLVSVAELDQVLIRRARGVAERSPDWWRQIGALLVRDGEVLLAAYNEHVPHEQSAYLLGDPRSNFGPGEHIDAAASLHAEAGIVARAAALGISTRGCDLYVTTFPCPPCAHLCAHAGLRRLYYATGYSLVAGADVLRAKGVELIHVRSNDPSP